MIDTKTQEYLRRNVLLARSIGVRAGVESILSRLEKTKLPPLWLITALGEALDRMQEIPKELAAHRDEVAL